MVEVASKSGTYGGTGTSNQGYAGGVGNSSGYQAQRGGGGGGAGGVGQDGGPSSGEGTKGDGGIGVQVLIAGIPTSDQPVGTPGPNPGGGYFAGGGAGGTQGSTESTGGAGGGANGGDSGTAAPPAVNNSTASTGGGGGGGGPSGGVGSSEASGIVVVRYQLGTTAGTAKATGGAVSFYNNKTIHTFTSTASFTAPGSFSETVDYVVIGGGGSGGFHSQYAGGGGGAGLVKIGSIPVSGPFTSTFTVGAGGMNAGYSGNLGTNGSDSTLAYPGTNITAAGGGGGGGGSPNPNRTGLLVVLVVVDLYGLPGGTGSGVLFPGSAPFDSPPAGWVVMVLVMAVDQELLVEEVEPYRMEYSIQMLVVKVVTECNYHQISEIQLQQPV